MVVPGARVKLFDILKAAATRHGGPPGAGKIFDGATIPPPGKKIDGAIRLVGQSGGGMIPFVLLIAGVQRGWLVGPAATKRVLIS